MKREIHFFRLESHTTGASFVTLPGQTLGRYDVISGVLVLDSPGSNSLAKAKKNAKVGETFFTLTLREARTCYTAADIHSLDNGHDLFTVRAREEFNKLKPYLHDERIY